jgi:hypothetical protein
VTRVVGHEEVTAFVEKVNAPGMNNHRYPVEQATESTTDLAWWSLDASGKWSERLRGIQTQTS